jgi:DNA polymerase III alpha subunit
VMLYEDDVMLVAAAMMGSNLDQADRFRKAVQKCPDDAARLELSRQFLGACAARGVDVEFAKAMWVQMAKFNAYSFCRAHAASYAVLAYAGAYLKAHWPAEFWCSALNNNQSMYPVRCYVEQAKRQGVVFLPPDVNRSHEEFVLEEDEGGGETTEGRRGKGEGRNSEERNCEERNSKEEDSLSFSSHPSPFAPRPSSFSPLPSPFSLLPSSRIRVGLNRIAGLGPAHIEGLLRARQHGPFAGLSDCLART